MPAMLFEFVSSPHFNFLTSFGQQFDIPVQGDTLVIPPSLGTGTIRKIDLGPEFKLLIHQYTLNDELILKRLPSEQPYDLISIIFHVNDVPARLSTPGSDVVLSRTTEFAVQIASADLTSTIHFPAHVPISYTVVGLSSATLRELLQIDAPSPVLQSMLNRVPGFLVYERLDADVLTSLRQLTDNQREDELTSFFYRIKVQELVYQVIDRLLRRDAGQHQPVVPADTDRLFSVRTAILTDLAAPPRLPQLARMVGMSQTRLKDLFRQVFGTSIYAYFQQARIEEAALLLRQRKHSVAEVGYRLGFENMSHFSRLFQKHKGIAPKKYAGGYD
ncbi:helix-turn-helix transcriptional regulator [Spirosoma rhododendri]|uniref:Helix-turn-helix transcriptional regulator n=1 Tax=Spirosoma rhododendri TaxID=2728024 RepID=A0A7L5DNE3_9BACT|nr:AraC family transcriptional regulator [Spirosoma rhododendri]QJD79072.1 helix-turn-helix transcriptional regulator [Spirosoma rhododendri]